MMNIPNLLTEYMRRTGMNQSELAIRLGVGHGMVSKWVRGVTYPGVKHYVAIEKLCKKRAAA